jgi:bifunctional UDP-N-acetylglucosamine pyrophosphorylase/glucosamine-1-phosphate N-acetyltransferase
MSRNLYALVLAAGQGTRFISPRAKVLHPLLGRSMIRLVASSLLALKPRELLVVVGHQKEEVARAVAGPRVKFVPQRVQLGTAHAVLAARSRLRAHPEADVLVIHGDLPLITPEPLRQMVARHRRSRNALTFMTADLDDPSGFGRIIKEDGRTRVVEQKEATPEQRKIQRVNVGVYVFRVRDLLAALPRISNRNKKKEFYLTDIVEVRSGAGQKAEPFLTPNPEEIVGVNTRYELAKAAEVLRERKARELAEAGVSVIDPRTAWIDLEVRVGPDTVVHPSVSLEGRTRIGAGCILHPFVQVIDSEVGNGVRILGSSVIRDCRLEPGAQVGPFAHLRAKTVLGPGSKVGNFVEMKNTVFGRGSKAMHLSYLGDSTVEEEVNFGAGTITCNFDGVKKNPTHIGAGAFIGSGTELVAPVKVGRGAYVGAGSVITKDVSPGALAVSRARQFERPGWAAKLSRKGGRTKISRVAGKK